MLLLQAVLWGVAQRAHIHWSFSGHATRVRGRLTRGDILLCRSHILLLLSQSDAAKLNPYPPPSSSHLTFSFSLSSPHMPPVCVCVCMLYRVKYTGLLGLGCVGLLTLCDLWQLIADTTIDLVNHPTPPMCQE